MKNCRKPVNKIIKFSSLAFFIFTAMYIIFLRKIFSFWGTTPQEKAITYPGDELVPDPQINTLRAVTIRASPESVYPWLVQMGKDKGGLYSYDWLENLFGLNIHSADRILPQWQKINLGDQLLLGPMGGPRLLDKKENTFLLFGGNENGLNNIWAFHLIPKNNGTTRLIVRSKYAFPNTFTNFMIWRVITEPLHFLMEQKMLRGIRKRVEESRIK